MNKKYKDAKGLPHKTWEIENDYCIEFIIEILNELNTIFDVYDYGMLSYDEKIKFKTADLQVKSPAFDIKTKNYGFVRFEYKTYFGGRNVNILNEYFHLQESIKKDIMNIIIKNLVSWTINKSNNIEN